MATSPMLRSRRLLLAGVVAALAGAHGAAAGNLDDDIARARRELSQLLEVYTEKHPDVIIARRKLDDMLARKREEPDQGGSFRGAYSDDTVQQQVVEPSLPKVEPETPMAEESVGSKAGEPSAIAAAATATGVFEARNRVERRRCADGDAASAGNRLCDAAEQDWSARASAADVFYANNFDYASRKDYLAGAFSAHYPQTAAGLPKLDLERANTLTGRGASRHNWFVTEGPNEAGPAWTFSFSGPGSKRTNRKETSFYLQYSMYVDEPWARFSYRDGSIKLLILRDPSRAPFAPGEIVLTRYGPGSWLSGFRMTNVAAGYRLRWQEPAFIRGDDTFYTFFDAGPKERDGETDRTNIDLFEERWGPRRRNLDPNDPSYASVPRFEGGKWYTIEVHVDLGGGRSVLKIWFAEYGAPPTLLTGYLESGLRENAATYRGGFLINRAENTTKWIDEDTFVLFDELLVSKAPIPFPGGYDLPWPGDEVPPAWPPAGARPR